MKQKVKQTWVWALCALAFGAACADSGCPGGAREEDGVCVDELASTGEDAGERDASATLDAAHRGQDGSSDSGPGDRDAEVDAEIYVEVDAGQDASLDAGQDATALDACATVDCIDNSTCVPEDPAICVCNEGYELIEGECVRDFCATLDGQAPFCGDNATCDNGTAAAKDVQCACMTDFDDCDHDLDNGCEIDLSNDPDNCGACGYACADGIACVDGECEQKAVGLRAGPETTCALMKPEEGSLDGEVRCWGRNGYGTNLNLLGSATTLDQFKTRPVVADAQARDLAIGPTGACTLSDRPSCWNNGGSASEWQVDSTSQVAMGMPFGCLVANDQARCWGELRTRSNTYLVTSTTPAVADFLPFAVAEVQAAAYNACARSSTGSVVCFGTAYPSSVPVQASPTMSLYAKSVVAGTVLTPSNTIETLMCALAASNSVRCWRPTGGAIGGVAAAAPQAAVTAIQTTAVSVPANVEQIAVGGAHLCMRQASGQVYCMGDGAADGALGFVSNAANVNTPTAVTGLNDAIDIVANGVHTCARRRNGQVVCWGRNAMGEIGDGSQTMRSTPTPVVGLW